jgi:hypothetical protein
MNQSIIALYEMEELGLDLDSAKEAILNSRLLPYLEEKNYDVKLFRKEFKNSKSYEDLSKDSIEILSLIMVFGLVETMFYNQGDLPPGIEKLFEITLEEYQRVQDDSEF